MFSNLRLRRSLMSCTLWLCAAFFLFQTKGQAPCFSPVPQQVQEKGQPFTRPVSFKLRTALKADAPALKLLREKLSLGKGKTELIVGIKGDKQVRRFAQLVPDSPEAYYLDITPERIVVAGSDEAGAYYGVQTLLQALRGETVAPQSVKDWPAMPERGVIEGFYGNPYSHANRLDLFRFMGEQKMNVYVYGPKDDQYHRGKWREDYPAAEAARLSELARAARDCCVDFVWAIHPGGDIRWNKADSLNILRKLESVYRLGVRSFCVFFDDIGGEGARAEKQAALLNYLQAEFVARHADVKPLMMCPTQYNKGWSGGTYLHTLGTQMHPDVRIMWTGNTVVDMIDRADMEWINAQIGRKAYIWLNYPVTDYCIDHLLMGQTYGNGLDIAPLVSGFCSNPMEYCEASKVSLFSIADYAWNTAAYDAASSWRKALPAVMPAHAEAFRTFCEHNVDLGSTGHGLRRDGESPTFRAALQLTGEAAREEALKEVFAEMRRAARELLSATETPALSEEIKPWVEAMKLTGERGDALLSMKRHLKARRDEAFIDAYQAYEQARREQGALTSRNFEGSIKPASPVVATCYVEPWLKHELGRLIADYKAVSNYRLDVFPEQALADGTYYILWRGAYLTDTGGELGQPARFVAERDTINPQRQEWTVRLDAETGRYSIVNRQASRYINELGVFGSNPFEAAWHTYELTKDASGRFAIRNGGSAGTRFWGIDEGGQRVVQSRFNAENPACFIFELVPVGKE